MDFPRTADDVEPLLDTMSSLIGEMGTIREQAATLTATATELEGRLQVTVNARGLVVHTVVDEDALSSTTASRLSSAFTAATQGAAQEVAKKTQELWAPVIEMQKSLPRATDILDGLPDIGSLFGPQPEPPSTAPSEPADEVYVEVEETAIADDEPHYEDLSTASPKRHSVTDRAW
ncbi:YbaB/EbfC family nucleoid-associated protein [Gordonia sp. CPCC 206044]|uniref:YbaB/EbfC family nucleoid-associated protein n=1 Tax=Gordonia sp. CPCC 206044 TaxID=3140793 RepID=UPI003AF373DB